MTKSGNVGGPTLVLGASGFIGRHLVRALLQQGRPVFAVTRQPEALSDLSHPLLHVIRGELESTESYTARLTKDVTVFHLAGARRLPGCPAEVFKRVNERGSMALARASLQASVRRFLYLSSAVVFGPSSGEPVSEAAGTSRAMLTDCYIGSRVRALQEVSQLANQGLPVVALCPTIVFGPDHPSYPNKITSQIRRLLRTGADVVVGGGLEERNLVFVEDVVQGILLAENQGNHGEIFILGGENVSHRVFNEIVLTLSGRRQRIRLSVPIYPAALASRWIDRLLRNDPGSGFESSLKVLTAAWQSTSDKAQKVLGYQYTPLRDGVRRTIEFVQGKSR